MPHAKSTPNPSGRRWPDSIHLCQTPSASPIYGAMMRSGPVCSGLANSSRNSKRRDGC